MVDDYRRVRIREHQGPVGLGVPRIEGQEAGTGLERSEDRDHVLGGPLETHADDRAASHASGSERGGGRVGEFIELAVGQGVVAAADGDGVRGGIDLGLERLVDARRGVRAGCRLAPAKPRVWRGVQGDLADAAFWRVDDGPDHRINAGRELGHLRGGERPGVVRQAEPEPVAGDRCEGQRHVALLHDANVAGREPGDLRPLPVGARVALVGEQGRAQRCRRPDAGAPLDLGQRGVLPALAADRALEVGADPGGGGAVRLDLDPDREGVHDQTDDVVDPF